MIAQYMVQPSSFMGTQMQMSQLGEVYLFRFNDELQDRFTLDHILPQSLGGADDRE